MRSIFHWVGWVGIVPALCGPAHAQSHAAKPWLIVPVLSSTTSSELPTTLPLEAEISKSNGPVIANRDGATKVETTHSAEGGVNRDQLAILLNIVGEGTKQLGMGDERALQAFEERPAAEQDYLRREPARAKQLFAACWMSADLLWRHKQPEDATEKMVECVRTFPGFRLPRSVGNLHGLFQRALERLDKEPHGSLQVSAEQRGCAVRLFGIEVGRSPVTIDSLRVGPAQIQLECDRDVPGRRHVAWITAGANSVVIDPRFDAALHTAGALWLAYANNSARAEHMDLDGAALENILGVRVLLLVVDASDAGKVSMQLRALIHPAKNLGELNYSSADGYSSAQLAEVVRALQTVAPPTASSARLTPPTAADTRRDFVAATLETGSAESSEGESEARGAHALPIVAGVGVAALGVGGLAVSWALYGSRVAARSAPRFGDVSYASQSTYRSQGNWLLAIGGVSAVMLSASEYFWLPQSSEVPPLAWVFGGAGVVVTGVGVGFVAGKHCVSTSPCSGFGDDATFGPLLITHALPLLSVPLNYWLRSRARVPLQVSLAGEGATISVAF